MRKIKNKKAEKLSMFFCGRFHFQMVAQDGETQQGENSGNGMRLFDERKN